MTYLDLYKKQLQNMGGNIKKHRRLNSEFKMNKYFDMDESYHLGTYIDNNLGEKEIDTRIVNVDNSVDEKKIYLRPNTVLNKGSYIKYEEDIYLIREFEKNLLSPMCKCIRCNQEIMLKGWDKPLPCYITNSSYGSKGEVFNNEYLGDFDARAVIQIGINKYVSDIIEGTRFIFNHSKFDTFETTKKNTTYNSKNGIGYAELTCKYVKNVQEDDLENNIAYNYYLENNSETQGEIVTLEGGEDDRILLNSTMTYTINGIDKCVFILDEDTIENNIAEIVSFTDNTVTVKVLKPKMFQIECRSNKGTLLCTRTLYGVRKM